MKKYFILFLMLYLFGVLLRIVGQLINGTPINWKSTLLLGEFDNTMNFDKRWTFRVVLMLLLPVFFVKAVSR
jgi:hypothetical protein